MKQLAPIFFVVLLALPGLFCAPCAAAHPATMPTIKGNGKSGPPSDDYKLVWSDEFDGKNLDLNKWSYRDLGPRNSAVNAKDAVSLDGQGHLNIGVIKVANQIHCGMIATNQTKEWLYGYFECSAKMQKGVGDWSAFWMQSRDNGDAANPKVDGDEIDIYEYFKNVGDGIIDHAIHWGGYGKHHQVKATKLRVANLDDGFHTFAVDWTPGQYVFYVDGVESWRTTQGISNHGEYLILSTEMARKRGFKDSYAPDGVTFDYVRVYQRPGEGTMIDNPPNATDADEHGRGEQ